MSEGSPYEAPKSGELDARNCPSCGEMMESGEIHASSGMRWISDEEGKWSRFVKGGEFLGQKVKSFSLSGTHERAFRCRRCELLIFRK